MIAQPIDVPRRSRALPVPVDDALIAVGLAVVALAQVLVLLPIASRPVGAIVALGTTLPIAWRRVHPVGAAVAGSALWLVPTDGYILVGYVAALFLYYSVGAHVADRRRVVATTTFGLAISFVATAIQHAEIGEYAGAILAIVAPVGVGVLVRAQRARNAQLEQLAAYLERERDGRAKAAVADERARIARELHDIVAHAVSVVAVQADAAEAALDRDPELARAPLTAVRSSAHEALDEMRRLVGAFRADGADQSHAPLSGLEALPALLESARAGGAEVSSAVDGVPLRIPQSIDLAAYRILQESLTNARKHAPGAAVHVRVVWHRASLELEVRNEPPGQSPGERDDGHGLVGMHERVRLHGGTFEAGTTDDGGFRVHAILPVETT